MLLSHARHSFWPGSERAPFGLWRAAHASADLAKLNANRMFQHDVGVPCATATPCGIAPCTKVRHSTAPLGFPGSATTRARSTTAARLRERMAFGVIFIDSARITSPNPG